MVGGSFRVDPMASSGFGGEVGNRVSRWLFIERSSGKTYCLKSQDGPTGLISEGIQCVGCLQGSI